MIRKNALFCKLIRIKKSSDFLFHDFIAGWDPRSFSCPLCHAKGNGIKYASYQRNIIDFIAGKTVDSVVSVPRILCQSCGNTHAILPDFIIPYSQYGLFFILRLLAEFFAGFLSLTSLCKRFAVSFSMFYRWKKLFFHHKKLWLGIIADAEISPLGFLKALASCDAFSAAFAAPFYRRTGFSFLQTQNEPALYRRQLF